MLEKYHKEILTCTGCAFCKKACQVYLNTRKETDSPKGKIMISYGLLVGEIRENHDVVKSMYKCALCRLCESVCPSMIKIGEIIKACRQDLNTILPEHEKILEEMVGEINGRRIFISDGRHGEKIAEMLDAQPYYISCGTIERIGKGKEIIEKFIEEARKKEVKIIYYEPGWKEYLKGLRAINVIDLVDKIETGNGKYAIHVPYDYDAEFFEKIKRLFAGKDVEFIRECCGGRKEFAEIYKKEAERMAEDVVRKSQGRKLITASLQCYSHLKNYGATDILHIARFKNNGVN